MRLPRKWLLSMAVVAALPSAGWAQQIPAQDTTITAQADSGARTNRAIAQDIASAMQSSGLTGRQIQIEVKGGVAVIRGEIGDAQQKETVTRLASGVAGVASVMNELTPMTQPEPVQTAGYEWADAPAGNVEQVDHEMPATLPPLAPATVSPMPPMDATPAQPSNQQIAQAVASNLTRSGLDRYDIEVRVKNGVCSLSGAVASPHEAAQAGHVSRVVPGIMQVDNKLTVNGMSAQQMIAQAQMVGQQMAAGPLQQTAGMMPGQAQPGHIQPVGHAHGVGVYNRPTLPDHAWPSYAPYDNYAAVTYPGQYDASAFPYIGPFYPYPQVPLGWRAAELEWDDGYWNLEFDSRTDKWWWFLNPGNWK